jgi:two-component system, chemotaxis family, CheB/CheR fusion protein
MSQTCAVPMVTKKTVSKGSRTDHRKTAGLEPSVKSPAAAGAVRRPAPTPRPFPVVGIGASAGGLEALETFFAHVVPDCGIAFVVVTHQHPGHTSLLPELLRKSTRMRVEVAADGVAIEPNCLYMSPSEGYLAILNGTLHLMEPDEPGLLRLPIDYFFRSLAEDQKEKAIGIVLSGTGTDGTLGLKAIKGAAGMTMAQAPESAKYAGMPSSAIATGLVDYVLPTEQIPAQLSAYAQGLYLAVAGSGAPDDGPLPEPMQKINVLLRAQTGHDFSAYKPNTIRRRIERRINVHQLKGPQQYLRFLQENPHELDLLFRELLIGVTNFFRDSGAFEALAKTALPHLLAARPAGATVRVWAPGCSTGEEAYSLAIVLQEQMNRAKRQFPVQIFATDLDHQAVEAARAGRYPGGIARDVRPQRLERFFVKEQEGYRIKKEIRELVIFAVQNVLKDPPFTKIDLLVCRNLLIYLQPEAQERVLSLFHYALNAGGLLFLGASESVGGMGDHFAVLDKKWKVFTRKEPVGAAALVVPFPTGLPQREPAVAGAGLADARTLKQQLPALLEKALLNRYAPACVIVNERGDILYVHGRTGDYLEPAAGQPRWNILDMAREGLRIDLAAALRRAAAQNAPVVHEGVRVRTNGDVIVIRLAVTKLSEPESIRGLLLVAFQTEPAGGKRRPIRPPARRAAKTPPARVLVLEHELQYAKETLQSTVEELETSNEELKSTNEELQSTNEEFQSANEELETSKEEMQSLNEELQTVNAQLQAKVDDLARTSDDMQNLLNSTEVATIFLDRDFHIKRFTPQATKLVNLIPSDVGRPIGDLASNLCYGELQADAAEVLRTLVFKEREAQTKDGGWRQVRILPYRTTDNVIDGLVMTFVNINRSKQAEQAAQQARAYAESIVATIRQPLLVLDAQLRVVSANPAFYRTFALSPGQVEHQVIFHLNNGQWDIPGLRRFLEGVLPKNSAFKDFEVERDFAGLGRKVLVFNARRLEQGADLPGMILLAIEEGKAPRGDAAPMAPK